MTAPQHIPAWKRLGLKLKHAPEEPEMTLDSHFESTNKRKASSIVENGLDPEPTLTPLKKAKKSKKATKSRNLPPAFSPTDPLPQAEHNEATSTAQTPSPKLSKHKSVSFTPDTKTSDGDSVKKLYQTWLLKQIAGLSPAKASEALRSFTPDSLFDPKTPPKVTSPKQSNRLELNLSPPTSWAQDTLSAPLTSTIRYLNNYHTSRPTWKFSKSKQNQVLKHAFDVSKIPLEHDDALKAYIMGLESPAARTRMRVTAREIRNSDMKSSTSSSPVPSSPSDEKKRKAKSPATKENPRTVKSPSETKTGSPKTPALNSQATTTETNREPEIETEGEKISKQYYIEALQRYKQNLQNNLVEAEERELQLSPEWQRRLHKRKRAELVLWSVGENAGSHDTNTTSGEAASDDGSYTVGANGVNGNHQVKDGAEGGNTAKRQKLTNGNALATPIKKKRKRKRRTDMQDDEDDSSSSSSSSSGSSSNGSDGGDDSSDDDDNKKGSTGSSSGSSSEGESETDDNSGSEKRKGGEEDSEDSSSSSGGDSGGDNTSASASSESNSASEDGGSGSDDS